MLFPNIQNSLSSGVVPSVMVGCQERAIYWYRNAPIPEFGHRTAEQLVGDRKTDAVLSYLTSIAGGSSG